jgi:nucleoside-diphosphate-sugar epimerase
MKKTLLVTGATGFIGRAVCRRFRSEYRLVTLARHRRPGQYPQETFVQMDITDENAVRQVCKTYIPDVVIHCAGLAHLGIFSSRSSKNSDQINCLAAKNLAYHASAFHPDVQFIHLSSISVYGEQFDTESMHETSPCFPTGSYAQSKHQAENHLIQLYDTRCLNRLDILRLAPVYDRDWTLNLDKRVFGPAKLCYLRFGSGNQKMSALARENLVDFLAYRLTHAPVHRHWDIINVCDARPYSFNEMIQVFQSSCLQPRRPVFQVPLPAVSLAAKLAGQMQRRHVERINSFYDKLAKDMVCDNTRMLNTGFRPEHTVRSVFLRRK